MEIHLQSDGQLYPPKPAPKPPKPPKPPEPKPEPEPPCPPAPCVPTAPPEQNQGSWEDFLLIAVIFVVLRSKSQPDLMLLAALAYILFDSCFSFKNLL